MTQQRIVASEGGLVGLAAEAGTVVGHDRDRRRDNVDDFAGGLVDQLQFAAVVTQVVKTKDAFGLSYRTAQASKGVAARPVGVIVMARQYLVA